MIVQVFIILFSCSAIWLVGRKEHWRRWGYILGLLGQPFWFYSAINASQWGIVALCCFYTYSWAQGVYNFWIKTELK
jgi:hypothetical protein